MIMYDFHYFRMMIRGIYDGDEPLDTESNEETELISFIEGYQEECKFRAMCAHVNNLVEYYIRQERLESAIERVEDNISILMTLDLEDEEVKWHLFTGRVLLAEILTLNNKLADSRKEIDRAFEIIPEDIPMWQLGVGRRREYYERGKCLRIKDKEGTHT